MTFFWLIYIYIYVQIYIYILFFFVNQDVLSDSGALEATFI